jgi:hypothetical protein
MIRRPWITRSEQAVRHGMVMVPLPYVSRKANRNIGPQAERTG